MCYLLDLIIIEALSMKLSATMRPEDLVTSMAHMPCYQNTYNARHTMIDRYKLSDLFNLRILLIILHYRYGEKVEQ